MIVLQVPPEMGPSLRKIIRDDLNRERRTLEILTSGYSQQREWPEVEAEVEMLEDLYRQIKEQL